MTPADLQELTGLDRRTIWRYRKGVDKNGDQLDFGKGVPKLVSVIIEQRGKIKTLAGGL